MDIGKPCHSGARAELRMPLVWSTQRDGSLNDMLPACWGFSPGSSIPESGAHDLAVSLLSLDREWQFRE